MNDQTAKQLPGTQPQNPEAKRKAQKANERDWSAKILRAINHLSKALPLLDGMPEEQQHLAALHDRLLDRYVEQRRRLTTN